MWSVITSVVGASVPIWMRCAIGLHEFVLHRRGGRLWLECLNCQHETRGVTLARRDS